MSERLGNCGALCVCIEAVELDEAVVSSLCDMGFPMEACKKAVYYTRNSGLEAATNWVMQHIGDSGKWRSPIRCTPPSLWSLAHCGLMRIGKHL